VALSRKVINLAWADLAKNPAQRRRVREIAIMEEQTLVVDLRIAPQMFDSKQIARSAHNSMGGVAFFQQQLSQIRTILSGDAGDESDFFGHMLMKAETLKTETLKSYEQIGYPMPVLNRHRLLGPAQNSKPTRRL
jgi:hypothetical protein